MQKPQEFINNFIACNFILRGSNQSEKSRSPLCLQKIKKKRKEIVYLVFRPHKNHKIIIKPRTLVQIEKNITRNSQKRCNEIAQRIKKNEEKMM